MKLWHKRATILLTVLILMVSATGAALGGWKNVPIWTVDGAEVDIGFLYEDACVTGPIAVTIEYPKGTTILLVEQDKPPYGYDWTTTPRDDFKATAKHIDLRVEAVIPSAGVEGCGGRKEAGVRLVPLDDRFDADTDKGRYDTKLVVRS